MESWVRYSVAVYVGLLLAGAVMQQEDVSHALPSRVQLSQSPQGWHEQAQFEARLQQTLPKLDPCRQPQG